VPGVVLPDTVKVTSDVPVPGAAMGLILKPTVTLLGSPAALKLMAELNPFKAVVVIVDVPLFPWTTVTVEGEAEMEKVGVGGPESALIRAAPFILPHPVARS
jgi:hypothetical protein